MSIPEAGRNYIIEIFENNFMDKLCIKLEIDNENFGGTLRDLEKLQNRLECELKQEIGVTPVIKICRCRQLACKRRKSKKGF
jgi:phenylacetate-coenzyme A ligase PaaK-like adenylate-forming protein